MLLSHPHEREVSRRVGRREKTNEGLVLEQDERTPRLEVVEEFRGRYSALDGGKSVVGGRSEQVLGQVSVLVQDQDNFVRVKPPVPEVGVNGTQRRPKGEECNLLLLPASISQTTER